MITDQSALLSKITFETPMGVRPAGSVFWAFFLLLFPVAAQQSSFRCVTYKRIEMCALKGSSVEFPCSYPNNVEVTEVSGWFTKSTKLHAISKTNPLKQMPVNLFQEEGGKNDCTLKLTDLKESDASNYFFKYSYRNVAGGNMMCQGVPGVRLHIFASPVSILLEVIVKGKKVPVADWTVMEGQKIMLTCVSTCAANLNSNPGYIWYKNRLQLNGSRANSPFLPLDPISNKDAGSYVCAMISHKDLPSSAVDLRVKRSPRDTRGSAENTDSGSKKDSKETLTHSCDAPNSTAQILNNCRTLKGKSMFTFSIMLVVVVCIGWAIVIMVAILARKMKKNKKRRGSVGSVPEPPPRYSDSYMTLDINSMPGEYVTLDTEIHSVYENLPKHQPGNC